MSQIDWIQTALAIEQAGSITAGATQRHLTQPAASQQLAKLERVLGFRVFERSRAGVVATEDGARFLREIATPFEQIEWLLDGLARGQADSGFLPLVVGCRPEWFEAHLVPRLDGSAALRARFDLVDENLLADLRAGRVDVAVTTVMPPASSTVRHHEMGPRPYVLVASPALAPADALDPESLGRWIAKTPWVGFSEELPMTRRFWSDHTGSISPTQVRLVVPDLRAAMAAVQAGVGASLVPLDLCEAHVAAGRLQRVWEGGLDYEAPRWIISARTSHPRANEIDAHIERLLAPNPASVTR